MSEWFQAKVKFLRQQDNGLVKEFTELYLIDAVSFTDAETRAFKEAGDNRDVQAVSIARSPIKEVVFYGDTDQWHKVKVQYSLMDEATEKEKKVTTYFLVNAATVKEAYDRTEEHLKTMLVPFTIPKVELSPIVEVFQYEKQAPKGYVKREGGGDVSPIGLTHDLKERRDEVKLLFGDKYGEKISEWVQPLRDAMKKHNTTNPFKAVVEISKEIVLGDVGGSLLIAVAVEMSEGNVADEEHEEDCAMEGDSVSAIDPTDGQAVAFEMDLSMYLQKIRPEITLHQIEGIREAYVLSDESFIKLMIQHGFLEDQAERISDILANEAAFEQDEEDNETDLESRFDAAMKGGGND